MKPKAPWFVIASVAIITGCKSQAPAGPAPKAVVMSAHGKASYATDGVSRRLRSGDVLAAGTVIETGKNSYADLRVNGASMVRLESDSLMELTSMELRGDPREGQRNTVITLQSGTVLCDAALQRHSSDSYVVRTPNGEARVQEPRAVFKVGVIESPAGPRTVEYGSAIGQLYVTATVDGRITNGVLNFAEEWTPGARAVTTNTSLIAECKKLQGASNADQAHSPPPPPQMIQPFNGFGAPITAIGVGHR